jgi:hypothetical protein
VASSRPCPQDLFAKVRALCPVRQRFRGSAALGCKPRVPLRAILP